jgi:hypothetical protein
MSKTRRKRVLFHVIAILMLALAVYLNIMLEDEDNRSIPDQTVASFTGE